MHTGFTLRQLEALMAVAEAGGFAAAARRLGISQPAISKHIHALEHHLGYEIFSPTPGATPRPTPRGRQMIDALPDLLEQIHAVSSVRHAAEDRYNIVRIGCGDALAEQIAELIPGLYAAMDRVSIELRTIDPSISSVLKLADEDIDLAYLALRTPPSERVAERIATLSAGLYLPARLSGARTWTPGESLPVVSAPDNSFLSRDFNLSVRLCGVATHHVVARVITQRDRIRLALAGIGAILSMDSAVREHVAAGALRRIGTGSVTLHRCRFINPARYRDATVQRVERFLTEALARR
ncbi:MAG: LysR family transcriptional regulator [Gammaproteobacteria bacterium]|nr:LysR family transcriptional regulator [Gammaproteobacteria bacterium]